MCIYIDKEMDSITALKNHDNDSNRETVSDRSKLLSVMTAYTNIEILMYY